MVLCLASSQPDKVNHCLLWCVSFIVIRCIVQSTECGDSDEPKLQSTATSSLLRRNRLEGVSFKLSQYTYIYLLLAPFPGTIIACFVCFAVSLNSRQQRKDLAR